MNLTQQTILLCVAGSRAYGLATPESDLDIKGVCLPTPAQLFGFLENFQQASSAEDIKQFVPWLAPREREIAQWVKLEGVIYELRRFMQLAADSNPNILDVLFCRDQEVIATTSLGVRLREARDLFVSAKAKHTFSGYAHSQLKRIRSHRAWILNPKKEKPTRSQFGLPEHESPIPQSQRQALEAAIKKQIDSRNTDYGNLEQSKQDLEWLSAAKKIGLDSNFIEIMQLERAYQSAINEWKRYQHWLKSRNPERAALEAKYGYDTKHGAHLVRLLRMGEEILLTGKVNVWREDRELLLGIRRGEWTYEELVDWAEAKDDHLATIYRTKQYIVPHAPPRKQIDRLCQELIEESLRGGR